MNKQAAEERLQECKERYENLKGVDQADAIRIACSLFIIESVIQLSNRNIQQEVKTREKDNYSARAPDAGGNTGIGGD